MAATQPGAGGVLINGPLPPPTPPPPPAIIGKLAAAAANAHAVLTAAATLCTSVERERVARVPARVHNIYTYKLALVHFA